MALLLLENAPIPADDMLIQLPKQGRQSPRDWRMADTWVSYMTRMATNVTLAPAKLSDATLVDQGASIAATDLSGGALSAGEYELRYWTTIVRAAFTSSSLTVTFSFTYRGVTKSASGAAIVANVTSAHQSGSLPLFSSDGSSPIQYSTTYASVGTPSMLYDLYVTLLRVQA